MVSKITSLQHPKVKELVLLRTLKEAREENQAVLLVGEKMIQEVAKKNPLKAIFCLDHPPPIRAEEHFQVTEEILKKISGFSSNDRFAAVATLPKRQNLAHFKRLLILDDLQDPGNVGTLLRTALAFSFDGVLFTQNTVDPFNDKVLRSSKGALFSLPYDKLETSQIAPILKDRTTFVADLKGVSIEEAKLNPPLALILSNEGGGPSLWGETQGTKITIPMQKKVESLNVAISGAILLYAMRG